MMHGATRSSAIQLCTLTETERTVRELRNMLHLLLALPQLVEQIHCNFCKLCSLNSLGPDFLSDVFSFKKKIKTTQKHSEIF